MSETTFETVPGTDTVRVKTLYTGPMVLPPARAARGTKDTFTTTETDAGRYDRFSGEDE